MIGNAGANSIAGLAELIVYSTVLSVVNRARVEKYLAAKWGLSSVPDPTPPVGYWRDRSGNGRHATQGTGGRRPVVGSQHNRRAMTFDGSDDNVSLTPSAAVGSSGYTVVAAIKHNLTSQPFYLSAPLSLTVGHQGRPIERWQGGSSQSIVTVGSVTSNVAGSYRSLAERFVYGVDALKDGVSAGTHQVREFLNGATNFDLSTNGTWSVESQRINVGTRDDGNTQYKGDICELCLYDRRLTTSERQRLERYLAAKWGIVLAPQVSNADAQDWVNRVYANGGTVSAATAAAVNQFCVDIDAAGLRSFMYRLNLFCGGTSGTAVGLNSALVPLYRGPSVSTTYGNTTDANSGGAAAFIGNDYVETGPSGGLLGNGNSKYLDTGIAPSNIPTYTSAHLAVYHSQPSGVNQTRAWIACRDTPNASVAYLSNGIFGTSAVFGQYMSNATANFNTGGSQTGAAGGFRVLSRSSVARLDNYYNAVSQANSTDDIAGGIAGVASTRPFFVFAHNNQGAADQFMNGRIMAYSVGVGLSQPQVQAYSTIMQAFQTALFRNL